MLALVHNNQLFDVISHSFVVNICEIVFIHRKTLRIFASNFKLENALQSYEENLEWEHIIKQ